MKKRNTIQPNENIIIPLMVKSVNQGITVKGKPYLSLVLQDNTGIIDGKFWDATEADIKNIVAGSVYLTKAAVLLYKESTQLKIESMEKIEEYDPSEFLRASIYSKEELANQIRMHINEIKDKDIRLVVIELFKEYHEAFFEFPAAMTNHHNYVRGLAEHVTTMIKIAKELCNIYPMLNRDLLIGAIILHDLGKVIELSGPVATIYTVEGRLLGHISIIVGKIDAIIEKFNLNSESVLLLKHAVLAHHGKLEFGSPVLPLIPEAEILHFIDNIDARMNAMNQALQDVEEGSFTQRIFALENRSFYKAKTVKGE